MTIKLWGRKSDESDEKIDRAQEKVCELQERADRAAESLVARLRRNHWGETIAEIARGER